MALETPKTKSEIKGNITSLKTRIENQEKLVKSYEAIVNNLNSKITAFQRFVNIEKLLKVEADPEKITALNTEKTILINKYPALVGKNQAAVEAEIVALEKEKKDRQNDLDKEIAILDEDKLNLRDHKAIDDKRPFAWMSKRGLKTAVIAAGLTLGAGFVGSKVVNVFKNKDSEKNNTEQNSPKADTTIKKGTKDTAYVMPTPATPKKDTVYVPAPSKDKEKEKELKDLKKKNKDLADRLKNVDQKKNDPDFDYFKANFEGFIGIGKDVAGNQILYKGKVIVFDNVKHAAEAQAKLGISPKRNIGENPKQTIENKSDFNPKSLGSYNENGRYKVKFNGEIYSYDNMDDAGKVQRAEKERVQ